MKPHQFESPMTLGPRTGHVWAEWQRLPGPTTSQAAEAGVFRSSGRWKTTLIPLVMAFWAGDCGVRPHPARGSLPRRAWSSRFRSYNPSALILGYSLPVASQLRIPYLL